MLRADFADPSDVDQLRTDCTRCRHFYLTWRIPFARGCRVYGFESSTYPALVIARASGTECQLYEPTAPAATRSREPERPTRS